MQRLSAVWLMVLAGLLFACMGVCVKLASQAFSTSTVVAVRGLVGALMMIWIARLAQTSLRTSVLGLHIKRGFLGASALMLWFYAIAHLSLATAVTLNYMSSIWMAVFLVMQALWWGGQRVDKRLLVAVLLGFAGVYLVLKPTIERNQIVAGLVGLTSGILAALAYLQVSALGRAGEPEVRVVFYFSLIGTVLGLGYWLFSGAWLAHADMDWRLLSAENWLSLLGVGCFATLAQLCLTRAYSLGNTLVNANLQYLGIVYAALFGLIIFDESLKTSAVLGMCLIVGAGMASARLSRSSSI